MNYSSRSGRTRPAEPNRALGYLLAMASMIWLAACGSLDKDPTAKWGAEKLYKEGHDSLIDGNWNHARETLEKLVSRYPFGRYAQQAQIEIAYTYYKQGETADALDATDRFLKQNPTHPHADYVYYLRGLINFIERPVLVGALVGYQVSERDPKSMRESFEAFKELIARFPDSPYAEDAAVRTGYLLNALASHEVGVADYYFRRGAYLAAIERAQASLRQYPGARSQRQALMLLAQSYRALDLTDLQADTERVIDLNYPDTRVKKP
jgi:outer membrane protein assembly factor BamD